VYRVRPAEDPRIIAANASCRGVICVCLFLGFVGGGSREELVVVAFVEAIL
jgi:hypothetical protein